MSNKNKKIILNKTDEFNEESTHVTTKYFFILICSIEILFILWKFVFASTRNGGTFLVTFLTVLAISFPAGVGVTFHIFRNKPRSFLFSFGLCLGFGFLGGVWALMIILGCPLNPYVYVGAVMLIAGCLLYRKRRELKGCISRDLIHFNLAEFLSPIAVLLFGFIVLSLLWINNLVPTDVDCQSDSFNSLMILKEGTYPFVSPYLDQTRLELRSGPLFHTLIAVITKLKNTALLKEIMAITVISGAFFCMAVYFLARFIIKNEIILFFAGILTLTRAYVSCFNDGNLPENIAFYYGAMFIVFLLYAMENKSPIFALFAGFYLSFCALSHPEIFMYNIAAYCLFFITLLLSKNKNFKKAYINLLIVLGILLIMVLPYYLRIKGTQFSTDKIGTNRMYDVLAATLSGTLTYWNGYFVPLLALGGIIRIATKRHSINIYLWTYFLTVLGLIEFWRFFQICSFSWFELKPLGYYVDETCFSYKTFLRFPDHYHCAWYGGVIILPIAIAAVINYLYYLSQQYTNIQIVKKYSIFPLIVIAFYFLGYEYTKTKRYPEFILKCDHAALAWIKDNTVYNNTLIYAPFDNAKENSDPIYLTSFWVPIVSERKSILFRNYNLGGSFKFTHIDKSIKEKVADLQQAAYTINNPESYKVLKDMKITHVFISGFIAPKLINIYNNSRYAELKHYELEPNSQGMMSGAFVFSLR